MNTWDKNRPGAPPQQAAGAPDDALESLFSHARARPRAPADIEQDIRDSLHAQWRGLTLRRRRRKTMLALGMAASVLVAVAAGINYLGRPAPAPGPERVAGVDRHAGHVFVHDAAQPSPASRALDAEALYAGQVLSTTPEARLSLTWASGESIRIDENSRVALASATEIELLEGRIYLDSGPAGSVRSSLVVDTPAGSIRHLGTQYQATLEDRDLAVSVREGRVLVRAGQLESHADPGQKLTIARDGSASTTTIPTYGAAWAWTEEVTPGFVLDGKSAFEFIAWVARETGRRVSYADAATEDLARATRLHGRFELAPLRALELILQTSDLVPEVSDGIILIRERPQET